MSFVTEVISGSSVPGVGSNGATHTTQVNVDSTGLYNFNPTSLAQTLVYAGPSGAISSVTAGPDLKGLFYKQSFGYTGSVLTSISGWVKQ